MPEYQVNIYIYIYEFLYFYISISIYIIIITITPIPFLSQFFLKGGIVMDKEMQPKNSCEWLTEAEKWDNICELEKLDNFHGIIQSFDQTGKEWRRWYRSAEPETMPLPGEVSRRGWCVCGRMCLYIIYEYV
jgi:hypothetical protein